MSEEEAMVDSQRSNRMLMVEDEAGDARLLQLAIRQSGFSADIDHVWDGYEALDYLRRAGQQRQRAPRPDLIVLDLKMPRLSGLDFLALIKQDGDLRAIPVVVFSSSLLETDVRSAYELGAAGYLIKPADFQELISMVRILGEYWFTLVRLPHND
ncbi:MAG TPA: response regulator [Accumulibacter sp.]|uniref:response regulator n=2 Tax=Accumulibacter sp. TaxID=2053492 RepID=UPI002879025F|nr:response regulator [Accumulibacter sp.]MDS4054718.1 response regulator [Accumulibacter sp.]HMV04752.1 response regulator [Accumulibacter sp.]HMW64120.1 response regulator [Accumulibacter sp.]HMW80874.1 response regulator [Accumulibacter sp.]HMX70005.1 response regulator [Accumulibacter sp.]